MSATSARTANGVSVLDRTDRPPPRRWIVNSPVDLILILLTPLLAAPAILALHSSQIGIKAETIALIVTAFFATGHHLPGLIRAYGDAELFDRFRWRFILAPPIVFLAYFPLHNHHFELYRLIILVWATWHGLMQLYGFVRIYDAKVGSVAPATAYWDWLLCLCGFITPQLLRPEQLSNTLGYWYGAGGPLLSASVVQAGRWGAAAATIAVLIGFTANYIAQCRRGPGPNPLKLVMLASGIGMWWFAMLGIENLLLSVALFDICHDVQYLAIVWLFNCRRVNSNPRLGGFLRLVFRRGMVLLYLGLITAYGALGLVAPLVLDGTVSRVFFGILFTSTILHYYYDGFIWKVRETTNQAGLGLNPSSNAPPARNAFSLEVPHLWKWSPALAVLGLLFWSDALDPPISTAQKVQLNRLYAQSLMGNATLPRGTEEQSWLFSEFQRKQMIAAAVPDDRKAQLQAAILLANFGRNDEALERLQQLVRSDPTFWDAHATIGGIYSYQGKLDQSTASFESALSCARTRLERGRVNLKWGEACLRRGDEALAEDKFHAALQDDPDLAGFVDSVRQSEMNGESRKAEQ